MDLDPDRVRNRRLRRLAALEQAPYRVPITFSIVGVQKAATSTLFRLLAKHPKIAAGPEKEIRLFIMEELDWEHPSYDDYMRPAAWPRMTMAGDATPEYLIWPRALERMRDYKPDMRLIAIFRDPIERAFSQWSMERKRRADFPDVGDTIDRWAESRIPQNVPSDMAPHEFRRRALYTRGLYGEQLERGLSLFPREQWLLLDMAEIATAPHDVLDRATDHLGLPRFASYPERLHQGATPTSNVGAAPTLEHIQRLVDLYADDLERFAHLSGLDISTWSTVKVIEGRLSIADFRDKLVHKLGLPG